MFLLDFSVLLEQFLLVARCGVRAGTLFLRKDQVIGLVLLTILCLVLVDRA